MQDVWFEYFDTSMKCNWGDTFFYSILEVRTENGFLKWIYKSWICMINVTLWNFILENFSLFICTFFLNSTSCVWND